MPSPLGGAEPALTKQVVAFLDLLGFRCKMVEAENGDAAALFEQYASIMKSAFAVLERRQTVYDYKGFTDNFVITCSLRQGLHPEECFHVVTQLVADFQLALAREGWFLRGGVAIGDFYMDQRIVFGPALVAAYGLEQSASLYPRVVLSDEAKLMMRGFLEFYAGRQGPQVDDVLIDADGYAFVNYLAANYNFGEVARARDDLKQHKHQVEAGLDSNRAHPAVWAKYRWAAQYHDYAAKAEFPAEPDLLISTKATSTAPTSLANVQLPDGYPVPWKR